MKDMLIVCDGSPHDEIIIRCAERIAVDHDAYLGIVVAGELPPIPFVAGDAAMYLPDDDQERNAVLRRTSDIASSFAERFADSSPVVPIHVVNERPDDFGRAVGRHARTYDFAIATLPVDNDTSHARAFDGLLSEGAHGVLGLPPGSNEQTGVYERVVVAWNGSRECARAVHCAMSFLQRALNVWVVCVDPSLRKAGDDDRPGDDIIAHLGRHGILATLARVSASDMDVAQAIMAEAERVHADLIVMGGETAGGLLQWLQGSSSRRILSTSRIPVFIAT